MSFAEELLKRTAKQRATEVTVQNWRAHLRSYESRGAARAAAAQTGSGGSSSSGSAAVEIEPVQCKVCEKWFVEAKHLEVHALVHATLILSENVCPSSLFHMIYNIDLLSVYLLSCSQAVYTVLCSLHCIWAVTKTLWIGQRCPKRE